MIEAPVVNLHRVSKSFGPSGSQTPVLRDVSLTINAGDKASLVGRSGSGKSTLLSLIAGLLAPDSGTVELDGVAISSLDDKARAELRAERIGIALQSDNLIPFLTAVENVELAFAFSKSRKATREMALKLLEQFNVAERATHLPRHLSGGEAQRVALAVAMANRPALLLADEVVAQLDGQTAGRVVDEVLNADITVLFVTHDIALADLADHRYELADFGIRARWVPR